MPRAEVPGAITRPVAGWLLITAVCGLIDAACFLALGGVFAEIMTGNLLLMAFELGSGVSVTDVAHYLVAILSFALGAIWGGRLLRSRHALTVRTGTAENQVHGFAIEWALVLIAVVIAVVTDASGTSTASKVVVGILAAAMGIQNAMVRVHGVPDVATNVMTLTLTGILADSLLAGGGNRNWKRRVGSVSTFFVAATIGAALSRVGAWLPLVVALMLLTAALVVLDVPRRVLAPAA